METTYLEHPTEEVLERFLLNQASQQENEVVETHFMGCASCAQRLEKLEIELTVLRSALQSFENERREKQAAKAARAHLWQSWFTVRKLSLTGAGAFAAVSFGTFLLP
jgi:anti-sigma factor RsiW